MENKNPNLEMILLEKPLCLKIGSKRFRLYQPTLGKLMLQQGMLEEITGDGYEEGLENEMIRTLVMVERHREKVCELLALYSFRDSKDCLDPYRIEDRAAEFSELETSELATILTALLAMPSAGRLMREMGIDKENERKKTILQAKDTKGSVVCGGATLYGGVIDHVMQRYGWSLQYTLWGISAANLQLLTSDEQVSLYLTEDEQKNIPQQVIAGRDAIDASDPKNMAKIVDLLSGKHK